MPNDKKIMKKIMVLICVLTISTLNIGMARNDINNNHKIFRNIYVQETNIGGLNKEESINILAEKYKPEPLKIKYQDKVFIINHEEIELEYNIENAVDKAYRYTHTDDKFENIKRMYNLRFKEDHKINLDATYNESKLSEIIQNLSKDLNIKVKNATIEIKDSGEILKQHSKEGKEIEIAKLKEEIYNMITKNKIEAIDLPIKIILPSISTEDVDSINTILGQYSTSFNEYNSRGSNIHVAGKSTSDIVIMPYETFSYNNTTGYRSYSNGYKSAKVIVGGKYVNGEGGGVCQVSTTIYNAALLAGMEIDEVHNHTFPSRYAPKGRDAAVSYGYTDFKFKNPYSHPIYIKNIVNNGSITSKIYGCNQDLERIYIQTEEKYIKDKINVKTYRIYLDEEKNKIREELVSNSIYKIK
ncbi:MAG: VanW family protein [Romboutsia sp.]